MPAALVSLSASLASDAWVVICMGMLSMVRRSAMRERMCKISHIFTSIYIYIYAIENLSSTVNQSEWEEFSEGKYR